TPDSRNRISSLPGARSGDGLAATWPARRGTRPDYAHLHGIRSAAVDGGGGAAVAVRDALSLCGAAPGPGQVARLAANRDLAVVFYSDHRNGSKYDAGEISLATGAGLHMASAGARRRSFAVASDSLGAEPRPPPAAIRPGQSSRTQN